MPNWKINVPAVPHLSKVVPADNPKAAMEIGIREQIAHMRKGATAMQADLDQPLPEVIDHAYFYDSVYGDCHPIRLVRCGRPSEDTYCVIRTEPSAPQEPDSLLPY